MLKSDRIPSTNTGEQTRYTIDKKGKFLAFLEENLPNTVPHASAHNDQARKSLSKTEFLDDVEAGLKAAPMSLRLTPYFLGLVDWNDPVNDPIRRQFVPLKSMLVHDHGNAELDSLHEEEDSPVPGLVHRYPDKVLFLGMCAMVSLFCGRHANFY